VFPSIASLLKHNVNRLLGGSANLISIFLRGPIRSDHLRMGYIHLDTIDTSGERVEKSGFYR
jgi:hypothetical protein